MSAQDAAVSSSLLQPQSDSNACHKRSICEAELVSPRPVEIEANDHSLAKDVEALDELAQPPPAKRLLSTSTEEKDDGSSSESEADLATMADVGSYSRNTLTNTRWALNNFYTWQKKRIARFPGNNEEKPPPDLLVSTDPNSISKWIALYAAETRKQDGSLYFSKSIYFLLAGLLRHMRSLNPLCPNFLHTENTQFSQLHESLEKTFHEREGVGDNKTPTPFTVEEEDRLWSSGALSTDNPKALIRAVYFLNTKNFGLTTSERHRELRLSHLKRITQPDRYIYNKPKCLGSFMNVHVVGNKKATCVDATVEKGNRCHVHVLDLYIQKLPPEAFEKDVFYLQPVNERPIHDNSPWFRIRPVGRNSLGKMIRDICVIAGLDESRRPHLRSLCMEPLESPESEPTSSPLLQSPQNTFIPQVYMFYGATTLNQKQSPILQTTGSSQPFPLSSSGQTTPPVNSLPSQVDARDARPASGPSILPAAVPEAPKTKSKDKTSMKLPQQITNSKAVISPQCTNTSSTNSETLINQESPQQTTIPGSLATNEPHTAPLTSLQKTTEQQPMATNQQSVIDLTNEQPTTHPMLPQSTDQQNFTLPQLVFNNCHVSIFVTQSHTQKPDT